MQTENAYEKSARKNISALAVDGEKAVGRAD